MKTRLNMQRGYTIIELLAVTSILVVISGIIVGILYSTLRSSSRTKNTTEVSQNGGYVLSVITNAVHDSRNIDQIGENVIPDDIQDCVPNPNPPSGTSITLKKTDGTTTTFACQDVEDGEETIYAITQDGVPLINTKSVKVSADSCSFTCDQSVGDLYAYPVIRVEFELSDKNSGIGASTPSLFETSISLNNYLP